MSLPVKKDWKCLVCGKEIRRCAPISAIDHLYLRHMAAPKPAPSQKLHNWQGIAASNAGWDMVEVMVMKVHDLANGMGP